MPESIKNAGQNRLPAEVRRALNRVGLKPCDVLSWARRPTGEVVLVTQHGQKWVIAAEVRREPDAE